MASRDPNRSSVAARFSAAQSSWRCGIYVGIYVGLPRIQYRGNVLTIMAIAHSRVTAQGQISVPAEVRKKLGVGPGSVLEWHEQDDQVVVRRAARYSSRDVHQALFAEGSVQAGSGNVKAGIRKYIRKRHARR